MTSPPAKQFPILTTEDYYAPASIGRRAFETHDKQHHKQHHKQIVERCLAIRAARRRDKRGRGKWAAVCRQTGRRRLEPGCKFVAHANSATIMVPEWYA